jgi:MFS family permease
MFLVPFGKTADIYGRKRIFTYGIMTFTLASVGSAISNSAMMLICFRILQGIGSAAIYPVGTAILTSVFPSRELGKVFGVNVAAGTLSTMRMTGMVFSTGVALLIFAIYIGKVQITAEYYPVFLRCTKSAFSFFTVLCFGGIFASLARGHVR